MSADIAAYWSPHTTHSDLAAFATPLTYAAWRHIPTTYVVCEMDKCIPPLVQEGMIASTEGKVRAVRLFSGHMPMLSVPKKLADTSEGMWAKPLSETVEGQVHLLLIRSNLESKTRHSFKSSMFIRYSSHNMLFVLTFINLDGFITFFDSELRNRYSKFNQLLGIISRNAHIDARLVEEISMLNIVP